MRTYFILLAWLLPTFKCAPADTIFDGTKGELRPQLPGIGYQILPEYPLGTIATAEIGLFGGIRAVRTNMAINIFDDAEHNITSQLRFTNSPPGTTVTISPVLSTNFSGFVQSLTNGATNRLGFGTDVNGSSTSKPESLFFQSTGSTNGLDLQGFQIDRIVLRFNELKLLSPGSDPNKDGLWTDFSFNATLFFVSDTAASGPRSQIQRLAGSNNTFQLTFPTVTNKTYTVQYTRELGSPTWLFLQQVNGTGGEVSLLLSNLWPHAFFSVIEEK